MSPADVRPFLVALVSIVSVAILAAVAGAPGRLRAEGQRPGAQTSLPADTAATGALTAAITGVVVDEEGTPVREALVTLWNRTSRVNRQPGRQFTDDMGRFAFVNLAESDGYQVAASSPGFRDGAMGRPVAYEDFGATIALGAGEWYARARITLTRFAAVTGTIVDDRGDPLVGAYVRAIGKIRVAGRPYLVAGSHTTTDDRGRYRLADLPPGSYLIQVPSATGTAPDELTTTTLAGGSPQALARYQATGRTPPVELTALLDRGWQMRLGRGATPPAPVEGRWRVFPITFFPGTSDVSQATAIDVRAGQERTADIRVMPVSTGRVSGLVQGPAEALANLTVRLVPAGLEDLGLGAEAAAALVRADGSFMFVGVPAGSYLVDTSRTIAEFTSRPMSVTTRVGDTILPPPMGPTEASWMRMFGDAAPPGIDWVFRETRRGGGSWLGRMPLVTDGSDISGVVVTMRELASLSGEVVIDAGPAATPARPGGVTVVLDSADGDPKLGRPEADANLNTGAGAFSIAEVMPGEYFVRPRPSGGWMVKSVSWKGRDVTDVPLDLSLVRQVTDVTVTMTSAIPTLSGVVRMEDGGTESAAVIVFPVSPGGWTRYGLSPRGIKTVAASTTGAFEFRALPAGDYFVVAVPDSQRWAWHEPGVFQRMSAVATRVRLSWGETTTQALRIVSEARW